MVSGNGTHGAMVFGSPENETVILNRGLRGNACES